MAVLPLHEKAVVRPWYPHMLPQDAETWTRFLQGRQWVPEHVWYDLHVGQEVQLPAGSPAWLLRVAAGVTRKRIDVVGFLGGTYYVVEVKPYMNQLALGQALVYVPLFEAEFALQGKAVACVVCDQVDIDVGPIANRMGVTIWSNEYVPEIVDYR